MLKIDHLSFQRESRLILNDVSLKLEKGNLLTLLGANGAGKSTLLNCIAGLLTPQNGEIYLNGQNCLLLSHKQLAQKVAYISQHLPQTYQYAVKDYVVLGRAAHLGLFNKPSVADFVQVDYALEQLGIAHLRDKVYMQLSGGQKQMVNIAKILVQRPQLILFDEPTSALDYGNTFKVLKLVQQLVVQGFSVIMTTHNPEHPILLSQELPRSETGLLTHEGKLLVGNTSQIVTETNLTQLYQQANLKLLHMSQLNRDVCTISHL